MFAKKNWGPLIQKWSIQVCMSWPRRCIGPQSGRVLQQQLGVMRCYHSKLRRRKRREISRSGTRLKQFALEFVNILRNLEGEFAPAWSMRSWSVEKTNFLVIAVARVCMSNQGHAFCSMFFFSKRLLPLSRCVKDILEHCRDTACSFLVLGWTWSTSD